MQNLRLVKINTTAFEEEDFLIITDLSDAYIKKVIKPMVNKERASDGEVFYSNEDYFWTLSERYPSNIVQMYTEDSIDSLSF